MYNKIYCKQRNPPIYMIRYLFYSTHCSSQLLGGLDFLAMGKSIDVLWCPLISIDIHSHPLISMPVLWRPFPSADICPLTSNWRPTSGHDANPWQRREKWPSNARIIMHKRSPSKWMNISFEVLHICQQVIPARRVFLGIIGRQLVRCRTYVEPLPGNSKSYNPKHNYCLQHSRGYRYRLLVELSLGRHVHDF